MKGRSEGQTYLPIEYQVDLSIAGHPADRRKPVFAWERLIASSL